MAILGVNLDIGELASLLDIDTVLKSAQAEAARDMAALVHARALELANQKLHSRREMFVNGLKIAQIDDSTWVVSLDAEVRWIDDGTPPGSMLDALLKSTKAKTAKDGSKFVVIPFRHGPGKGKTSTTPAQQDLISTVKKDMKSRGIPFGTIEKDAAGKDKLGRVHSFDIMKSPIKKQEGPGQGRGPIGQVKQGFGEKPLLAGVNVYQSKGEDGKTKRSIMTFRIASSKHRSQNRWESPGTQPMNILEDAAQWAQETFDKEIAPAIVNKISTDLK